MSNLLARAAQGLNLAEKRLVALGLVNTDSMAASKLFPGATAGREFSKRLAAALQASESLVIESTLSGASIARSIAKARERGYEVTLVFVFLDSAELCLRRITERVAQGGHDVPEEDVRRRFTRAAPVFWQQYRPLAHQSMVVFNGRGSFLVVAETLDGQWKVYDEQMWAAFQALLPAPEHDQSEEG